MGAARALACLVHPRGVEAGREVRSAGSIRRNPLKTSIHTVVMPVACVLGLLAAVPCPAEGLLGSGDGFPGSSAPSAPVQYPTGLLPVPVAPVEAGPEARLLQESLKGYMARIVALEERRARLFGAARVQHQARGQALAGAQAQRDSVSFPASLLISRHREWAREEEERARVAGVQLAATEADIVRLRGEVDRLGGEIQNFVGSWLQDEGMRRREAERFARGAAPGETTTYNLVFAFNGLAARTGGLCPVTAPVPGEASGEPLP